MIDRSLRDLRRIYPAETYATLARRITASPCTHYRLKDAIELFDAADPVDAYHDAILLAELMAIRLPIDHHAPAGTSTQEDQEERMRHNRPDYNTRSLDMLIAKDEPVFLIRGQDQVAGDAVRAWADLNEAAGGDPKLSQLARQHAHLMDSWPKKKLADL